MSEDNPFQTGPWTVESTGNVSGFYARKLTDEELEAWDREQRRLPNRLRRLRSRIARPLWRVRVAWHVLRHGLSEDDW